jgi:hypothetical protein
LKQRFQFRFSFFPVFQQLDSFVECFFGGVKWPFWPVLFRKLSSSGLSLTSIGLPSEYRKTGCEATPKTEPWPGLCRF